jgi:hypothetical protein
LIASDTKRRQRFQRSKHPDVKEKQTDNTQQKKPPPQKRETEKEKKIRVQKSCQQKITGFFRLEN